MSGRLSNVEKRLAKVEQQASDRARRQRLAHCNCYPESPQCILFTRLKEFEEMIVPCPAHGLRRLGKLIVLQLVEPDGAIVEESVGLKEAVRDYERRLSEFLKSHPELEDDIQEP